MDFDEIQSLISTIRRGKNESSSPESFIEQYTDYLYLLEQADENAFLKILSSLELLFLYIEQVLTELGKHQVLLDQLKSFIENEETSVGVYKKANYYLGMYEFSTADETETVISYLLHAGDVAEAKELRTKLFQQKYMNRKFDNFEDIVINFDIDTLLYLLKYQL